MNNPVTKIPGYRHYLANSVKSLLAIDRHIITDEERIENTSYGDRFRALSFFMEINVPDFEENILAEEHIFNLDIEVYRMKRFFEKNSPSIRI